MHRHVNTFNPFENIIFSMNINNEHMCIACCIYVLIKCNMFLLVFVFSFAQQNIKLMWTINILRKERISNQWPSICFLFLAHSDDLYGYIFSMKYELWGWSIESTPHMVIRIHKLRCSFRCCYSITIVSNKPKCLKGKTSP